MYLHASFGIMTEEGIELWSLCIKVWCVTAELPVKLKSKVRQNSTNFLFHSRLII